MEADLQAVYGIDYRDRWRRDPSGRARLTLRRLSVLITHLPDTSCVAMIQDDQPRWRLEHILLAHVWQASAGSKQPHPMLAAAQRGSRKARRNVDPDRRRRLTAARRRARERRRLIDDGVIT